MVLLEDGTALYALEETLEMILELAQFAERPILLDLVDLLVVKSDEIRNLVLAEHLYLPGFSGTLCSLCWFYYSIVFGKFKVFFLIFFLSPKLFFFNLLNSIINQKFLKIHIYF